MNIKKLIRLDFYTMKPLANIMMLFLIVPVILGLVADEGMSIMVTMTFVVFMLNVVFAISEKSHFNKLYGILPIKRSQSVISRYLFSLIILGMTALFSFLIYCLLSLVQNGSIHWLHGFSFLILSSTISIFFISIQYPFYFHFEYSKATMMSILPYIITFAIGAPLLSYLMKRSEFYQFCMEAITYFQSNPLILLFTGIGVSFFLILVSYLLSIKFQKTEF